MMAKMKVVKKEMVHSMIYMNRSLPYYCPQKLESIYNLLQQHRSGRRMAKVYFFYDQANSSTFKKQ